MSKNSPIHESKYWRRGNDIIFRFTVRDPATGAVVDISNWAMDFVLRQGGENGPAALTKTTTGGGGITIQSPASAGIVEVAVLDTDTDTMRAGAHWYLLRRTNDTFETPLAHGDAYLHP